MGTFSLPTTGITGAIFVASLFFFYRFLTSYLDSKGKNYADKRDIEIITHKVEDVKTQYATTSALLNANLSLVAKGLETFEAEAFKSYVSYHQACSYILNDVSNIDFTGLNFKNIEYLRGYNNTVMDAYKRVRISKANHDLFNDNVEIRQKATELFTVCINYVGKLSSLLSNVTFYLEEVDSYSKLLIDKVLKKQIDETYQQLHEYCKKYKVELETAKTEVKEYVIGADFNKAIKTMAEYEFILREQIKDKRIKILTAIGI